jgi:N-acetylglucosamine-6-phosphate deacetylase
VSTDSFAFVARRYDTGKAVQIALAGGSIAEISAPGVSAVRPLTLPSPARGEGVKKTTALPFVAPGFFDIQINGYGGQEFSSAALSSEGVARIVRTHFSFGVTRVCPTLTTESFEVMRHGVAAIRAACERFPDVARAVAGIHLEGPYLSREDGPRGAHPAEHCRAPDWSEFAALQDAAGGRVRLLTMSPEFDNAPEFIARATDSGVLVAIGHTGATGAQIRAAVDAGARLSTHLGNGAHRTLRRHPNYIWDQLAEDRLWASLIVDGHHLPPEVVKTFLRAKSPQRMLLVSDISGLAGLPPGRYASSGCELEILADGRLVIAGQDQLLAGASLPIGTGIANVMRFAGLDLATAVDMATRTPAELLRLTPGGLAPSDPADLVLFDLPEDVSSGIRERAGEASERLQICATILAGELVFGSLVDDA